MTTPSTRGLKSVVLAAVLAVGTAFASSASHADDASGLNSRVCNNISLAPRERAACKREMSQAHSDEDRAKVRKEYEDKIVAARARKTGS